MNRPRARRPLVAALLSGLVLAAPATAAPPEDGWAQTGTGITAGISGIAVTGQDGTAVTETVVVHDNKRTGQPRVSRIRSAPGGTPRVDVLRWDGEREPVDLEALSAVPGVPGELVALESSGRGYHLRLAGDAVRVLREFTVPGVEAGSGRNHEAFHLTGTPGRLTAVWAHRGQDEDPAVLYTAALDWRSLTFGTRRSAEIRVPFPATHVRHISDLAVSPSGRVTVTSASDPGDDGPFDSAVYDVGRVVTGGLDGPRPAPRARPLRLAVFPGHKIEALACASAGRAVLGTDDENAGGSWRVTPLCPR
ncbi:hypothetical protein ACFWIA_26170 [Streptomyces sp. NPDC127068]|uniref:hypothetical protein n=1 Tax=Streptomyces sp. NPDC127068 TaxID=3347127 RepID=UPI00365F48E9